MRYRSPEQITVIAKRSGLAEILKVICDCDELEERTGKENVDPCDGLGRGILSHRSPARGLPTSSATLASSRR